MAGAGAGAGAAADVAVTLSSVAYRMFRIRRTVCALLTKRGYIVPSEDATMNAESFAESVRRSFSRCCVASHLLPPRADFGP